MTLDELLKILQDSEAGAPELDLMVGDFLFPDRNWGQKYTRSLDVTEEELPENWYWRSTLADINDDDEMVYKVIVIEKGDGVYEGEYHHATHKSVAVARCMVLIKAIISERNQ